MTEAWVDANQRFIVGALGVLHAHLAGAEPAALAAAEAVVADLRSQMPAPPALERLAERFGLSPFERDIVLLCAGVELDTRIAMTCSELTGDARQPSPTFSLALAKFPTAHWNALGPTGPLRRFALIELGPGTSLTRRPLHISERILHVLVGVDHPDERLDGIFAPRRRVRHVLPSYRELGEHIARSWGQRHGADEQPVFALCGASTAARREIAAAACEAADLALDVLSAGALTSRPDADGLLRLVAREAVLRGSAVLIELDDLDAHDTSRLGLIARLVQAIPTPVLLSAAERPTIPSLSLTIVDTVRPTQDEQRALWRTMIEPIAHILDASALATVDQLAVNFDLGADEIHAVCQGALVRSATSVDFTRNLREACRVATRSGFGPLAQRIQSTATWDDLVLSRGAQSQLREIVAWMRHRSTLRDAWGPSDASARGLALTALFAGPSGTGKTTAAEVLANELQIDLCRVDLSQIVSKYIGDTEKHLRQVFDAAERSGALLLFDEADALFSRRAEVRDSVDRYANLEVAYLLQRIEAYRGLVVLTTNLDHAIDRAFIRRLAFVVRFPWPTPSERAAIWRRAFPAKVSLEGIAFDELAEMSLSGAAIRNIARRAAYLAIDAGSAVRMEHIVAAARAEHAKTNPRQVGEQANTPTTSKDDTVGLA